MIEFSRILELHDQAWTASTTSRERGADDLMFSRVTQWDDPFLNIDLEYRGQFDLIRKARREFLSEMRANPVQVSYLAGLDGTEEGADLLEGKYRFDVSTPAAKQALLIAQQDQFDAGKSAWRLTTDYENSINNEQYIKREPIHEANNRVFRDPNCEMIDGSDAEYYSVIWTITHDGWPEFAKKIGANPDEPPSSFRPPEDSFKFPWVYQNKQYNIGEFYHRTRVNKKAYLFVSFNGNEKLIEEDRVDDLFESLEMDGFTFKEERDYETFEVRRYWVGGGGKLTGEDGELLPGTEIPIIEAYGEVSKVENQWYWEGGVRLAKDPQRLRNFMMSYIADIAAKGSRQRPYFGMSQIMGLEWQFEEGGPDQNRAFRTLNDTDELGNPLPQGPIDYEKTPDMPQAAVGLLEASNAAINDVTGGGVPMEVASLKNMAEGTIDALNEKASSQFYTYLDNMGLALQREAEVYASMRGEIYDTERDVTTLGEDGREETVRINQSVINWERGRTEIKNDLSSGCYKVRTKVTKSFANRKSQQRSSLMELFEKSSNNPEAQNIILSEIMLLSDEDSAVLKKYARRNLLLQGLVEAETEEEVALLQASQQNPQEEQMSAYLASESQKNMAEAQESQARTAKAVADAQKARAQTAETLSKVKAQDIQNAKELAQMLRGSVNQVKMY